MVRAFACRRGLDIGYLLPASRVGPDGGGLTSKSSSRIARSIAVRVDAAAARFITHPETLDVVVASNLFADILTDVGGAIQGSLGLAASASIDPERRHPSLFESVHGSAPDIMGLGIANPIATVWAGALMLDFLGEQAGSERVRRAIERVTEEGTPLTPDLGGGAGTKEVGGTIVAALAAVG